MNPREMDNRAFDRIEAAAGTLDPKIEALARRLLAAGGRLHRQCDWADDETLIVTGEVTAPDGTTSRCWMAIENSHLEADCSCPKRRACEHLAALLITAPKGGGEQPQVSPTAAACVGRSHLAFVLAFGDGRAGLSLTALRVRADVHPIQTSPYALSRARRAEQPGYIGAVEHRWLQALGMRQTEKSAPESAVLGPDDDDLLAEIIDRGKAHWQSASQPPLKFGPPIEGHAVWRELDSGVQYFTLEPSPAAGTCRLPFNLPWLLQAQRGECHRVKAAGLSPGDAAWLFGLGAVDPYAAPEVIREMNRRGIAATIARPKVRKIVRQPALSPQPVLVLERSAPACDANRGAACARLRFRYGPIQIEAGSSTVTGRAETGKIIEIERDFTAEQRCAERLKALGLVAMDDPPAPGNPDMARRWFAREPHGAAEVWARVQRLAGWQWVTEPDFDFHLVEPECWYGLLSPAGAVDFELELGAQWQGRRYSLLEPLLAWLDAVPAGELQRRLHSDDDSDGLLLRLDPAHITRLPAACLRAALSVLIEWVQTGVSKTGRLKLPRARLAGLSLWPGAWQLDGDAELLEITRALGDLRDRAPCPPPPGLRAELRAYQRHGLGWLQTLRQHGFGGLLADDMGLGKTLQILAHILTEKTSGRLDRPCLIVAPTTLLCNWRAEASRFAPELNIAVLHGPRRQQEFAHLDRCDIALTSYALLSRDHRRLQARPYHLVVLDEAQAIKNPAAAVSRHACRLEARQRLCLSGTPLENHLGELWSLFHFAVPGLLGSAREFRARFRLPIELDGDEVRRRALKTIIEPFLLRRTKSQVTPELPPVSDLVRTIELGEAQRRLYDSVRVAMHDKVRRAIDRHGAERSRITVLDALLKLRQICCDPRLAGSLDGAAQAGSAKLDLLRRMLPELIAEGRRILLFSQFTSMLDLIETEIKKMNIAYLKLTGRTRDRAAPVARFQRGDAAVFLISLKAGGAGLNLTAADTVIHYDPWWNPAVEDQATSRAHRIGQSERVFSYRLITAGTVEQRVLDLQVQKRLLIDGLFDERLAPMTHPEAIDHLFAPVEDAR